MSELSALAGSEGYGVCADNVQGVQPLGRSEAAQEGKRSGGSSKLRSAHTEAAATEHL
jgi:hypothetical protein